MKFLRMVCVLCALAVPTLALDREAFTFTNYDLTVRVEPEQQRLGVRGKITLRNDSPSPQKDIALQISSTLDWKSIAAAGKAVRFVTHEYISDIDHTGELSEAIVILPREVPPKGTIELGIGYEGVIPLDVTRLTRIGVPEDKATAHRLGPDQQIVHCGARNWIRGVVSGGDGRGELIGREQRRRNGSAMECPLC